jgi:excisionase family DNA binding protein
VLTVSEAAARAGRDPETVRRWIRSGRLPSHRDGPRHLVEAGDVDRLVGNDAPAPLPSAWERTTWGAPQPDWTTLVRRSRGGRS